MTCSVEQLHLHVAACELGVSFGCFPGEDKVWVSGGCRAGFRCGGFNGTTGLCPAQPRLDGHRSNCTCDHLERQEVYKPPPPRGTSKQVEEPASSTSGVCGQPPYGIGCNLTKLERYQKGLVPAYTSIMYSSHPQSAKGGQGAPRFEYDYFTSANIESMRNLGFFRSDARDCEESDGTICPRSSCTLSEDKSPEPLGGTRGGGTLGAGTLGAGTRGEGTRGAGTRGGASCTCNGGSHVSLVVRDALVPAALCMKAQLQRLGSVCPYVIVHDLLSDPSLARLQHAFGSRHLFALADLKSAAEASSRNASISSSARLVTNASTSETAAAGHEAMPDAPAPAGGHAMSSGRSDERTSGGSTGRKSTSSHEAGRRLYEADVYNPVTKMFLYALPRTRFPVALSLDVDLLLLANPDRLLCSAWNGSMAAEPCFEPPIRYHAKWAGFGTGYFLFRPDSNGDDMRHMMHVMANGLRIRPTKLPRVCESIHTDQSKLNAALAGRISVISHANQLCQPAWYHFFGEPKPWAELQAPLHVASRPNASQVVGALVHPASTDKTSADKTKREKHGKNDGRYAAAYVQQCAPFFHAQ